jgi:superfamily I DNA/RNA helicase
VKFLSSLEETSCPDRDFQPSKDKREAMDTNFPQVYEKEKNIDTISLNELPLVEDSLNRQPAKNVTQSVELGISEYQTVITEQDKVLFAELKPFLSKFNDEQKKAIISQGKNILCIAGAGSGKTTVLTKRIEFLIKYQGIDPKKILAITFTRKAKEEMKKRLFSQGINTHVETFNSFCEKVLGLYWKNVYGRPTRMINYNHKVMLIMSALESLGITMDEAVKIYFEDSQKRNKDTEELSNLFMNDCFFIIDYFKVKNKEIYDFSSECDFDHKEAAKMIYEICRHLKQQIALSGLRDYTDQVLDVIRFFKENPERIPRFEYVLVDEYQDVNDSQIDLLELLNPANLFCVGDPRQSIFGWRGSKISHILDFKKKYPEAEIIALTRNYRSNKQIVEFMNRTISHMNLPDLVHDFEGENEIFLNKFDSENEEYEFVVSKIIKSEIPREKIFALARTNRQILDLSEKLRQKQIPCTIKTDEVNRPIFEKPGHVTLATIHAIKGLEAAIVFVLGCNEQNFPCKASDHPIIEIIKMEDYNKEEEEKRLFYVAVSRAKKTLYLTYSGKKQTHFITSEMISLLNDMTKAQATLSDFDKDDTYYGAEESAEGNYGEYESSNNGGGYSQEYNPYKGEDWDDMIGKE